MIHVGSVISVLILDARCRESMHLKYVRLNQGEVKIPLMWYLRRIQSMDTFLQHQYSINVVIRMIDVVTIHNSTVIFIKPMYLSQIIAHTSNKFNHF